MKKNLFDISSKLGVLFNTCSPQVKNGSLEWYLAGSLSTMIMGDALEISEAILDENNNIISFQEKMTLNDYQRSKIRTFERPLGSDVDVINVNGNMFGGASFNNKPSIDFVKNNISNITDLIPSFEFVGGTGYIDNLEKEHDVDSHHVTKVTTPNGIVFITSIPEQIAYKLNDLLIIHEVYSHNNNERVLEHYKKDIRDITFMICGYKDLYSKKEFVERVSKALKYPLNEKVINEILIFFRNNLGISSEISELIDFLEYLLINVHSNQIKSSKSI